MTATITRLPARKPDTAPDPDSLIGQVSRFLVSSLPGFGPEHIPLLLLPPDVSASIASALEALEREGLPCPA
jgi:hypothetical protein